MLEKTTDSNIIDGGNVICGELDKKNGISKNNFLANWLITKKQFTTVIRKMNISKSLLFLIGRSVHTWETM